MADGIVKGGGKQPGVTIVGKPERVNILLIIISE